jgi:hypothetical protein
MQQQCCGRIHQSRADNAPQNDVYVGEDRTSFAHRETLAMVPQDRRSVTRPMAATRGRRRRRQTNTTHNDARDQSTNAPRRAPNRQLAYRLEDRRLYSDGVIPAVHSENGRCRRWWALPSSASRANPRVARLLHGAGIRGTDRANHARAVERQLRSSLYREPFMSAVECSPSRRQIRECRRAAGTTCCGWWWAILGSNL